MASIHQNLSDGNSYFRPFRHDAKNVIFLDIRCRLPTDIYGQPFMNMKLRFVNMKFRFPGWRASARVCQFAAKHWSRLRGKSSRAP
jgi:hypothetical protein